MKYKPKVTVEDADDPEDDEAEDDIDDPIPALLACLLLSVSCEECGGSGFTGSEKRPQRCQCRDVAQSVAVQILKQEGLSE